MPLEVNLLALLTRFISAWRTRIWSAYIEPIVSGHFTTISFPFLLAMASTVWTTSSISVAIWEAFEDKIHLSGLDLGQIENVVDQRQKMAGSTLDAFKRLDLIVAVEFARILLQHLGHADDGIERRAQFVRHVGKKAGFRAACLLRGVARNLKLMHEAGKFRFPLLELGNVRVGGDDAAVRGLALVDVHPTAIGAALNVRAIGYFVLWRASPPPKLTPLASP